MPSGAVSYQSGDAFSKPVSMNSSPVPGSFAGPSGVTSAPVVFFSRISFARNLADSSPIT